MRPNKEKKVSLRNLVKDMTKRELYVLVLVSGMLPDADAAWLEIYGDDVIKSAELMADKMLSRVPEFKPMPFVETVTEEVTVEDLDADGRRC